MALDPQLRTPNPPVGEQYDRDISLVIGNDKTGQGLDFSNFRVIFSVVRDNVAAPNLATVQVFNLQESTERLVQKEYTRVILKAGYKGRVGQIFDGLVVRTQRGQYYLDDGGTIQQGPPGIFSRRESPTDTFLYMIAQDGDTIYNYAMMHVTLAAGATVATVFGAVADAIRPFGGSVRTYVPQEQLNRTFVRGQALHGQVRDVLTMVCATIGASWSIQGNIVEVVMEVGYIQERAIVLNSATGLIGQPQQTINGIELRVLLNPYIVPGRAVQLDNKAIQQLLPPGGYTTLDLVNDLDGQGLYKVLMVKHSGDTRGNPWYTDIICIGIDQAGPDPRAGGMVRVWS